MKSLSFRVPVLLAVLVPCLNLAIAQAQPSTNAPVTEAGCIQALASNSDLKAKMDACRELSRLGSEAAVPALALLLGDDQLSHSARYALETIPGKSVERALRQALKTTQGRNLAGVIGSLGVRRDEGSVGALANLLSSGNPEVAQAAARALGKIGGSAAASALEKALPATPSPNQPAVWEGLLRCADGFLAAHKESKAAHIYETLAKADGPPHLKTAVVRGRVLSQPKLAAANLESALGSANYVEFAAACRTSRELTNVEVTRVLIGAMGKTTGDRQILLIQTLGIRGDVEAAGALGSAAARPDNRDARLAALRALGQLSSPASLPFLTAFISDSDPELARIARESFISTPSPEVEGKIQRMLNDKNPATVAMGLELAARRRQLAAYEDLLRISRGKDADLRLSAIRKLAELAPGDNASEPMKIFLQSTAAAELEAAEQTLTTLSLRAKDREAAAALVSGAWTLGSAAQQKSMLNILAAVGGSNALNAVRTAVASTSPEIRAAAIRALGSWTSLDATPDLLKIAGSSSDPTEKLLSLRSYMNLVTESDLKPEQRLELCRQVQTLAQQPEEKKLLLSVLGGINSPQALELVRPLLGDTAVAEEAQNAVLRISEKALQAKSPEPGFDLVIPCLEQTARDASNPALKSRAEQFLPQARTKAAQK